MADENFPPALVSYLQKLRHDIKRIQRTDKGVSDKTVIEKASKENRIIFTFDSDFFNQDKIRNDICIVLFKFPDMKPAQVLPFLDKLIKTVGKLKRAKKFFIGSYSKDGWLERK
ncbi:DUF5615 family PIN-like protein [Candidatus Daviesbacteria bacterium]|nr:DUF5615 family PIN-like protein [Candidatus Daviesbacteria bacterium]